MNYEKLNQISIVNFLMDINVLPEKIQFNQAWYKAFYRGERTASLKVDITKNVFYDFGEGYGGSIVQLAERIYGCRGEELMEKIKNHHTSTPEATFFGKPKEIPSRNGKMKFQRIANIAHPALIAYLQKRRIDLEVARYFCKEVKYETRGKEYFSIGFQNSQNGFEFRNSFFKSSSSPKHYTILKTGSKRLAVFEGFFDLLSFITLNKAFLAEFDFLILNSVAMIQKLNSKFFEDYHELALFLDNDSAGKKAVVSFQKLSNNCRDFSFLYKDENDLNDWLITQSDNEEFNRIKSEFFKNLLTK